jgi:nucleoid DNA-binding protein
MSKTATAAKSTRDANKPLSKSETYNELANMTDMTRKQVAAFFDALGTLMARELSKKGAGQFAIPGLLRVKKISKPATKATTRPNPFKPGEMMEVKAKPARNVVKAQPLKGLKDLVK